MAVLTAAAAATDPPPAAYVYSGPGAGTRSVLSTMHSLREALRPSVKVATLDTAQLLAGGWQQGCLLLVMPGGADLPYCKHLNGRGNELLREHVEGGGSYLGLCAGAYYACARVEFEPGTRLEVVGDRELAFFPGTAAGSIYPGFDYESEAGAVAAPLRFKQLDAAPAGSQQLAGGGGSGGDGGGMSEGSAGSREEPEEWAECVDYPSAALKTLLLSSRPAAACTVILRLRLPLPIGGPRFKPPGLALAAGGGSGDAKGWAMPHLRQRRLVPRAHAQQQEQPWMQQGNHHAVLEMLNNATKWAVSCVAFGTLLWRRDLLAAWCVLGSVVAAVNCRVLKYAINQARPSGRKADPGMPSAHAQSLGFLATFVSVAAAASLGTGSPSGLALVLGVPSAGIFLTWLRVALGYHTVAQVVVGWLVGSCSAAAWHLWGSRSVLPAVLQQPQLQAQLYAATAAAVAFFIYQNVRRWAREAREQRQLSGSGGSSDWS
ncbi:hypothetical protein ABPG77_007810 [Micractinium sp. CCAP 211/92]